MSTTTNDSSRPAAVVVTSDVDDAASAAGSAASISSEPNTPRSLRRRQKQQEVVQTENFPKLYASYFFAAWGDRMWEFAAIIFLMAIFPTSLFPSSLFGFSETIAGILLGSKIGNYVDSTDRLQVIRVSIVGQNVIILFASLVFIYSLRKQAVEDALLLQSDKEQQQHHYTSFLVGASTRDLVTLLLIVVSGMIAKVASSLNKISIHKDWSVVLAAGNSAAQTSLNSNMRRVDLSCSILAPLAVGVLSSAFSPATACTFIACWSVVSIFVEFYLSKRVYDDLPALQSPKRRKKKQQQQPDEEQNSSSKKPQDDDTDMSFLTLFDTYLTHPVFPISLPYCLLYISVLSFGGIMVAYLRTLGCSDWLLAAGRGLAALVAIGATFAVPSMVDGLGLVGAGKLTVWLQVAALAPLAFVFFATMYHHHEPTDDPNGFLEQTSFGFIATIFASVCLSRFGLWAFDIVQTQLMQESILLSFAGRVNGAQEILVNFCYLVSYTLTMIWDDPAGFAGPALVSFGSILLAAVLFGMFAGESYAECLRQKEVAEAREDEEDERQERVN